MNRAAPQSPLVRRGSSRGRRPSGSWGAPRVRRHGAGGGRGPAQEKGKHPRSELPELPSGGGALRRPPRTPRPHGPASARGAPAPQVPAEATGLR